MKILIFVMTSFLTVGQIFSIDPLLVHDLRKEFLQLEDELWKFILKEHSDSQVDPGINVIRHFYDFDQQVQKIPQEILHGLEVVRQAKDFLFLYSDLRVIHDLYDKFRRYQLTNLITNKDYPGYRRQISTTDMVDDILYDEKNNVNATLTKMFDSLLKNNNDYMILDLFDIVSNDNYNCRYNQPPQQVFYNLYNVLALIDLKGYVMMQFAYMASRLQEKGNNTESSLLAREQYKVRANNTMTTLRGFLEITSGKKWMCDPKKQIEGITFVQVTRLLQGHVQNEVDLNSDRSCKSTCNDYSSTRNYGCYDGDSDYCRKRKSCNGDILNCRFIESHMKACISPMNSVRRYEFVQYDSGRTMGDRRSCQNKNVQSWHRWFVHCSYCMCLCDEEGPLSDRYFNTRPVMADVDNNRVVTGLRIIKHNRIIHLQIQQGKLLPYGYIDNNTVRWAPVDDFKITDFEITSGEDYHTMSYKDRTLLLDELAPHESNHIITGVRFEYLDGHLRFQINVRPFDFKNGTLSKDHHWVYGTGQRTKINVDNLNIPTKAQRSEPMWGTTQYVQFTHTSFDADVAQTTVPFFDSQPVTTFPQVPLRGAGIFYKASNGYGGYIAPSITTYDFSKHMEMEFPDPGKRDDDMEFFEVLTN